MTGTGGTGIGRRLFLCTACVGLTHAGVAGCLRFDSQGDQAAEQAQGAGDGEVVIFTARTPDDELRPGEAVEFEVTVRNRGEDPRDVSVVLKANEELIQQEVIEIEPESLADVPFQHTFTAGGSFDLTAEVRIDDVVIDYRDLGEYTVASKWPLTLEWGRVQRPVNHEPDSQDNRALAFFCSEIRIEDGDGITRVVYNIGGPSEPELTEGYHGIERHDELKRWFGTHSAETTFLVEEIDPPEAAQLVLIGRPYPDELPVTVYEDGVETDSATLEPGSDDRYELSLEP